MLHITEVYRIYGVLFLQLRNSLLTMIISLCIFRNMTTLETEIRRSLDSCQGKTPMWRVMYKHLKEINKVHNELGVTYKFMAKACGMNYQQYTKMLYRAREYQKKVGYYLEGKPSPPFPSSTVVEQSAAPPDECVTTPVTPRTQTRSKKAKLPDGLDSGKSVGNEAWNSLHDEKN